MDNSLLVLILLAVHALLLMIFVIFTINFFRRLFRNKNPGSTVQYHSKVIAIGLTSFVFGQTLFKLFVAPLMILINDTTYLISLLSFNTGPDRTVSAKSFDINFLNEAYLSYFRDFPLSRVLMAIAVGVILYKVVLYIYEQTVHLSSIPPGTTQQKNNAFAYNMLVMAILSFSLFLVISVFISIPYLNEIKKPALFSRSNMDTTLNVIRYSDTSFRAKDIQSNFTINTSIKDSLFTDSTTKDHYAKMPKRIQAEIEQKILSVDRDLKQSKSRRADAISKINTSIDQHNRDMQSNKDKLLQNYQMHLQSNAVDKDLLFSTSTDLYRIFARNYRTILDQAYTTISENDQNNTTEYTRLLAEIRNDINTFYTLSDSALEVPVTYYSNPFRDYNVDILGYASNFDFTIPVSKRDGSDWGLFGLIARFLIKTESIDLVLLIGMLGFGLLGASVSSFQADPPAQSQDLSIFESFKTRPIIPNFWNVLVRGFSAAILIYLATKGGIAILTTNVAADPNGYILLMMCFIGAVFSEKVWTTVREKYKL